MSVTSKKAGPRYHGWKVTREEYLDLEDDGYKYDMLDGVLHAAPSAGFFHGKSCGEFYLRLALYLRDNPLGTITQETDVFLPDGGDVLRPDVCFLFREHMSCVKTHIHGVPDLVCESLPDRTEKRDLGQKASRYLTNGVSEYWILDSRKKTAEVWYNNGDSWEKHAGGILDSRLLPGFQILVQEFWDSP